MLAKPELDETSLKLLEAADLLEKDGWCTQRRMNDRGERCLLGALDSVYSTYSAVERLAAVLPFTEGKYPHENLLLSPSWRIANWNNYACKNGKEAADKLREAAYNNGSTVS